MPRVLRSQAVSNFNQAMDSNSSSVPPNQLPDSVPTPSNSLSHDRQEDKAKLALQHFCNKQFADIQNSKASKGKQILSQTLIEKIMKAADHEDTEEMVIDSDAPIVFAKACEIFVQELATRAWTHAEAKNKNTLDICDVAMAIKKDDVLSDLLADVADCGHNHHALDSLTQERDAKNQVPHPDQMKQHPHVPSDQSK